MRTVLSNRTAVEAHRRGPGRPLSAIMSRALHFLCPFVLTTSGRGVVPEGGGACRGGLVGGRHLSPRHPRAGGPSRRRSPPPPPPLRSGTARPPPPPSACAACASPRPSAPPPPTPRAPTDCWRAAVPIGRTVLPAARTAPAAWQTTCCSGEAHHPKWRERPDVCGTAPS